MPHLKGQGILVQKTYHVRPPADESTEDGEAPLEESATAGAPAKDPSRPNLNRSSPESPHRATGPDAVDAAG